MVCGKFEIVCSTDFEADPLKMFADSVAQGISARSCAKIAKVSGPTATRDLAAMERAGALTRSEAGGRSTHYRINY
jgi:Fic family protein